MHYSSIKKHLRPYGIIQSRKTTINHAFAAAIAPHDNYVAESVKEAMIALGQNPENLICTYCRSPAETWDHVFATVKNSTFSGHGHRLGNLLPCCKQCNSAKGNKDWRIFFEKHQSSVEADRIASYLASYRVMDQIPENSSEYDRLIEIKAEVLALLSEADRLATIIRQNTL